MIPPRSVTDRVALTPSSRLDSCVTPFVICHCATRHSQNSQNCQLIRISASLFFPFLPLPPAVVYLLFWHNSHTFIHHFLPSVFCSIQLKLETVAMVWMSLTLLMLALLEMETSFRALSVFVMSSMCRVSSGVCGGTQAFLFVFASCEVECMGWK